MTSPSRKTAVNTARTKYKHKEIIASNDQTGLNTDQVSRENPDDRREDKEGRE